ncbi:MAG: Mfa1 family fimbria major subunit [Muribaculaceae bacterium]|nr:Mfa1 family fimbria major subunit [Muribaculaceae bacterium]
MKKIYGYAMAMGALLLASCSSDAPEAPKQPLDGVTGGYLKMSFDGLTNTTRANDIPKIENVTFVFYDGNGAKIGNPITVSQVGSGEDYANKFVDASKESAVVLVEKVPHHVEAYVNANASYSATIGADQQASAFTGDVCSSAMYSNNGTATTKTPLDGSMIYYKSVDAKNAPAENVATIYVDRLYAKVNINLNVSEGADDLKLEKGFHGYTVEFVPEIYFVNGVATTTTNLKGLNTSAQGQSFGNGLLFTNDPANGQVMSHWAAATGHAWNKTAHYSVEGAKIAKLSGKTAYIYENTPANAGATKDFTHVIVAGKYKLTDAEGKAVKMDKTFWTFGSDKDGLPIIYTEEAELRKAMNMPADAEFELITTNSIDNTIDGKTKSIRGLKYGNLICNQYTNGWLYYAAPIQHFTFTDAENNTSAVYGIVRNHAYVININKITGYGVPLTNPDEPIVPEDPDGDKGTYHLQLNVKVNNWFDVPGQEFDPFK